MITMHALRSQVVYFLNQDVLDKIPLFTGYGMEPAFVGYLMSFIKPQV